MAWRASETCSTSQKKKKKTIKNRRPRPLRLLHTPFSKPLRAYICTTLAWHGILTAPVVAFLCPSPMIKQQASMPLPVHSLRPTIINYIHTYIRGIPTLELSCLPIYLSSATGGNSRAKPLLLAPWTRPFRLCLMADLDTRAKTTA